MQIGVTFPQTEIGADPIVIRDYAQAVEGLGYSHLVAFDHVLGADRGHASPLESGDRQLQRPVSYHHRSGPQPPSCATFDSYLAGWKSGCSTAPCRTTG